MVRARVVGGLQIRDRGEADDKIIAVLQGDYVWGNVAELADMPEAMVERLEHYFLTYKLRPGQEHAQPVRIAGRYGAEHARAVIRASIADYSEAFGAAG